MERPSKKDYVVEGITDSPIVKARMYMDAQESYIDYLEGRIKQFEEGSQSLKEDLKKAEQHYKDTNDIWLTYAMISIRLNEMLKENE